MWDGLPRVASRLTTRSLSTPPLRSYVPMFGQVDFDPSSAYPGTPFEDVLEAAGNAVAAGKIKAVGASNESAAGLMLAAAAASPPARPRLAAVSNAYSLLGRNFEQTAAEAAALTGVPLLAYGPHAAGLLTGKYADGGPPEARLNRYKARYAEEGKRYASTEKVKAAVAAYVSVARDAGIAPAELALRFVLGRPQVAAAVVGATAPEQLAASLAAAVRGRLPDGVLAACDAVHALNPNPAP